MGLDFQNYLYLFNPKATVREKTVKEGIHPPFFHVIFQGAEFECRIFTLPHLFYLEFWLRFL